MRRFSDDEPAEGHIVHVMLGHNVLHQPLGRVGIKAFPIAADSLVGQGSGAVGLGFITHFASPGPESC